VACSSGDSCGYKFLDIIPLIFEDCTITEVQLVSNYADLLDQDGSQSTVRVVQKYKIVGYISPSQLDGINEDLEDLFEFCLSKITKITVGFTNVLDT
jgi:hypothetical protein